MRSRYPGLLAGLVAGLVAGPPLGSHVINVSRPVDVPAFEFLPNRRRGKGKDIRRGKGAQAKPKKRRNRVTISRRVRRKHRRAA